MAIVFRTQYSHAFGEGGVLVAGNGPLEQRKYNATANIFFDGLPSAVFLYANEVIHHGYPNGLGFYPNVGAGTVPITEPTPLGNRGFMFQDGFVPDPDIYYNNLSPIPGMEYMAGANNPTIYYPVGTDGTVFAASLLKVYFARVGYPTKHIDVIQRQTNSSIRGICRTSDQQHRMLSFGLEDFGSGLEIVVMLSSPFRLDDLPDTLDMDGGGVFRLGSSNPQVALAGMPIAVFGTDLEFAYVQYPYQAREFGTSGTFYVNYNTPMVIYGDQSWGMAFPELSLQNTIDDTFMPVDYTTGVIPLQAHQFRVSAYLDGLDIVASYQYGSIRYDAAQALLQLGIVDSPLAFTFYDDGEPPNMFWQNLVFCDEII